ncbi:MAG: hypothetical protein ACYC8T_28290 [Myxococcaceae bacterium]
MIAGKFTANYTLLETEGSCGAAKPTSTDPMTFTEGNFDSPVVGLVKCATTQTDCEVVVSCTTAVLPARMDFNGTLSMDGTQLAGTAILKGSFRGCTHIRYDVAAQMEVPLSPPDGE